MINEPFMRSTKDSPNISRGNELDVAASYGVGLVRWEFAQMVMRPTLPALFEFECRIKKNRKGAEKSGKLPERCDNPV